MIERLQEIVLKPEKIAVGLISGTSMDGVDAVLTAIKNNGLDTAVRTLAFDTLPYPDEIRQTTLRCAAPDGGTSEELCRLNFVLGELFAEAFFKVAGQARMAAREVDFIGSHGQTVQHQPQRKKIGPYEIAGTLQLGEPSLIAKRTGILTVADFRPADMAVGGEGAPLIPYFDYLLFRSEEKARAMLNIGGIANFTVLPRDTAPDQVMAFDTGPGNMIIDYLARKLFETDYDIDGEIALSGRVSKKLLHFGLQHDFFARRPPKSTGREEFGQTFGERFLAEAARLDLKAEDIISTATELTVVTVAESFERYILPNQKIDEIIVSGGGVKNQYIMQNLQKKTGLPVKPIDDFGIPSEAKEAICFAVLANETLAGNPANMPSATGAREATILGKICP